MGPVAAAAGSTPPPPGDADPVTEVDDTGMSHMLVDMPAELPEDKMSKVMKFQQHAQRLVASCVCLEVEPIAEVQMTAIIKASAAGKVLGLRTMDETGTMHNKTSETPTHMF